MKKRSLSLFLALVMVMGLCVPVFAAEDVFEAEAPAVREEEAPASPVDEEPEAPAEEPAPAAVDEPQTISSGTCGSRVTWDLTGGTLTIQGTGAMYDYQPETSRELAPWYGQRITSVVIADGVTSIGAHAFLDCGGFTHVTIPASVTSIGEGAFERCGDLAAISLSAGLQTIGAQAFSDCDALTSITIPYTVTAVGHDAFAYCGGLTKVGLSAGMTSIPQRTFIRCEALQTVSYPSQSKITLIGSSAFEGCVSLRSFTIPNGVVTINHSAFAGCTTATSVTIPASVQTIGEYAFADCTSLSSVTFLGTVQEQYDHAFSNTPWLAAKGSFVIENGVLLEYQGPGGRVTIPDSVTSIGDRAFFDCADVTAVTIPSSVKSIGERAFASSGLRSVTIPSSVTTIGDEAFLSCVDLKSVFIPSTVKALPDRTFFGCRALSSVIIPEGVRTIGAGCFRACVGLTAVVVPSTVTSIGEYAFAECRSLRDLIIDGAAFTHGEDELFDTVTVYGTGTGTARQYAADMGVKYSVDMPSWPTPAPDTDPSDEVPLPPGGNGWRYYEGNDYYFINGVMKKNYWAADPGASKWNFWYYCGPDGKMLQGLQYIENPNGTGWYMLQYEKDDFNCRGRLLTGWQNTGVAGTGWFTTSRGVEHGKCTYTTAWGDYNAATGLWSDGQSHR